MPAPPQKPPSIIDQDILKNVLEIIHHTGLLKIEMVNLNIDDVKHNGCIMPQIQPVSGTYPKGFEKTPVSISGKAKKLIDNHIKYLQSKGLSLFPKSPLFPVAKTNERYEETKLWYSLSTYCIYNGYERHREAGIHGFCWELLKTGHNKQQIIPAAHQFSRYSNLKRTAKLVEEGILIDPMAYESAYRKCRDAADRLITFHEVFPHKIEQYIFNFQHSFETLFDRDKKTLLNYVNKELTKRKKELVQQENLLAIEEITGVGISLKKIKRKKRRKIQLN